MASKIQIRRDTAANWTATNPVLAQGEPGLETDTSLVKYGDGITPWADLSYSGSSGNNLTDEGNVVITTGSTEHWIATQRREDFNTYPMGLRYDSLGNLYTLTGSDSGQGSLTVLTKYTAAGAVSWQKSITNRSAMALAVDSDDRAFVATQFSGEFQIFKFGTDGTILWKQNYACSNWFFNEVYMEELSTGNMIVAVNADPDNVREAWLFEISGSSGSIITKKNISRDGEDVYVRGIDVVNDDDTVFVTGHYYDSNASKNKMFIEKMDNTLTRVWSKGLSTDTSYNMNGGDCASDVHGNVYAVGFYEVDTINWGNGTTSGSAAVLTKLNSSGAVQWTRRIGPGQCSHVIGGLTVTDGGDIYLTTHTTQLNFDPQFEGSDYDATQYSDARMIVARYDNSGNVAWQRYVNFKHLWEQETSDTIHTISVFNDKFALMSYGYSSNSTPFNWSGTDDSEDDLFVVQLPIDGTELSIGDLEFVESRIPGRFITHTTTDISSTNGLGTNSNTITVTVSSVTPDAAARIANNLIKSDTYEYTFGANGTLTVPNDGDLKLTQTQVGYLVALGGAANNNHNVWGRAVTVDSQGYMYVAGQEDSGSQPFVTKISPEGNKDWSITIEEDNNGDNGRVNGISINPTTGNIVVVCEFYNMYTYSAVIIIDQDTGRILNTQTYYDSTSDVYLNDIAYLSTGNVVVAGSKNGEFSAEQTITTETGSTTGVVKVLRSGITGIPYQGQWQIGGTGFSAFENIQYLERYTGLTATVRQGSDAVFTIDDNGNGTYSVLITNGGTNYLAGHKIKILGTSLGGATPANDITITVDATTEGGVISSVSNTGTAAGTGTAQYTGLSGTNYNVGSGAVFYWRQDPDQSTYTNFDNGPTSNGSNYADYDVITISGDQLGGTSPTNDLTAVVNASGGSVYGFRSVSGNAQTTMWKIQTSTQVDFGGAGSWSVTYPLARENFVATPTWQRTFGTNEGDYTDRLYALAVDSSDNVIVVGQGYGEIDNNQSWDLATVWKFASTGSDEWVKQLNERNYNCAAMSVTTIGTDIYVTHDSNDNGDTVISKLDTDGNIKWQRVTDSSDDSVIARTPDGNLLVAVEAYNNDIDDNSIKVFKLTPAGETVYKRWLLATTDSDTNFKNGRGLAAGADSFYITGYFYANNYDSALAARLPLDGSGVGEYGSFRYTDVSPMNGSNEDPSLNSFNYTIDEVDLSTSFAGDMTAVPYMNSATTVSNGSGAFYVDWYSPNWTLETVRDTDGGCIVFADGSTQSTSATDTPQRRYTGQRYTLGMADRGRHILCNDTNEWIYIPYNARVEFPIGTTIVIVNMNNGSSVYIGVEGGGTSLMVAGDYNNYTSSAQVLGCGVGTLMKVGREQWVLYGNVDSY